MKEREKVSFYNFEPLLEAPLLDLGQIMAVLQVVDHGEHVFLLEFIGLHVLEVELIVVLQVLVDFTQGGVLLLAALELADIEVFAVFVECSLFPSFDKLLQLHCGLVFHGAHIS